MVRLILLLVLAASAVFGQGIATFPPQSLPIFTIGAGNPLPLCSPSSNASVVVSVRDAASAGDCTVGSGVTAGVCQCNGPTSTWTGIAGGGGGGDLSATDIDTSAEIAAIVTNETGSGLLVFGTNPVLTTPNLGTPSAAVLTNATGLPIATGVSGLGAGVATFLATPSSANLATAVTGETGSGGLVFDTSPTLATPNLGTPSAAVLTNATGLPAAAVVVTPAGAIASTNASDAFNELDTEKQTLLAGLSTVNFSDGLSAEITWNWLVTGTVSPYLKATDNLLRTQARFQAKTLETGDGTDPGAVGVCEAGATPSCITWEAPAALTNPLGFTFPNTRPAADGTIMLYGNTAADKSAVTFLAAFSSGVLLPAVLPASTTSAIGAAELATTAETTAGTDAARVVTPDGLAGSIYGRKSMVVEVLGLGTACTTGDKKRMFPIPADVGGMNLVAVSGHVDAVGTTNTVNLDIARCAIVATGSQCSGTVSDVLSTNLTIDSNETRSATAAVAAVIDTANDDVADGQAYRFDIDACPTTPSTGLWAVLTFETP